MAPSEERGSMIKIMRQIGICLMVAMVILSGCGYTRQTVLPRNIKTIYVETVKNKIDVETIFAYQPGLEMDITNAVIERLQQKGVVKVVSKEHADAILKTDLIAFTQQGLRFTNLQSIAEYQIFIEVRLRLIDAKTNDLIWEEPTFTGDNEYYVSNVNSIGEQKAAQDAVARLAFNIVDRIVQDW